jgi:hypothetical protein
MRQRLTDIEKLERVRAKQQRMEQRRAKLLEEERKIKSAQRRKGEIQRVSLLIALGLGSKAAFDLDPDSVEIPDLDDEGFVEALPRAQDRKRYVQALTLIKARKPLETLTQGA